MGVPPIFGARQGKSQLRAARCSFSIDAPAARNRPERNSRSGDLVLQEYSVDKRQLAARIWDFRVASFPDAQQPSREQIGAVLLEDTAQSHVIARDSADHPQTFRRVPADFPQTSRRLPAKFPQIVCRRVLQDSTRYGYGCRRDESEAHSELARISVLASAWQDGTRALARFLKAGRDVDVDRKCDAISASSRRFGFSACCGAGQ